MSMLNKKGNVFTLFGIQEEKETLAQKQLEPETITLEEADLFLGRSKGIRPHYSHTDYDSIIQKEQNDD